MNCEECGAAATHAERSYLTVRAWCDVHVPRSGQHEFCDASCTALLEGDERTSGQADERTCGLTFARIADGQSVTCVLPSGHTCAHAWGLPTRTA